MKLNDKIWLLTNRKRPKQFEAYLLMAICWTFVGMLITLIFLAKETIIALITGAFVLLISITFIRYDMESHYIESLHKCHLRNWEQKRTRLLLQRDIENKDK